MGAGDRFKVDFNFKTFGLAVMFERWPYDYSLYLMIGPMIVYLGFGKAYHE